MRRPAFYALLLFSFGILLGNFFDLPVFLLFSISCLTLIFCLLFQLRKEKQSAGFFLILSLILVGFFRHELLTRVFPPNHISNFLDLGLKITISGKIAEEPDVRKNKTFLIIEAQKISLGKGTRFTTGQIILKIKEPTYRFDYADKIRFRGYLNQPTSKRNPGVFDYRRYLSRKRIYGIVTLSSTNQVEILRQSQKNIFFSKMVIPLRRWILGVFDRTLSGNHNALLAGFLLGEKRELPKDVYNMFRDTGTVHLLAVSGSNVWLVIGVIFVALSLFRVPRIFTTIATLICIFIFAHLVHNDPPVVRAGIMAAVILLSTLLYKDVDLVNVVSFAGLAILFFSPLFLFDVGFQLSFVSVFAILLLYPKLSKLVSRYISRSHKNLWRWALIPALVSFSVELVLFPILAYYFNLVPLVTVVANIFIVPLAGLSVVLACFTLFFAIFSNGLANIFSASNWLILELTLRLTEVFATLPIAKLSLPAPSIFSFVLYYFFLWFMVSSIAAKKKALLFLVLITANLLIWSEGLSRSDKPLRVTFLDVGQGSSAVIQLPNQKTLLVNAGEKRGNFDAGESIVTRFLNHKGINQIDKLILTDSDSLNFASALSVLENRSVEQILLTDTSSFRKGILKNLIEKMPDRFVLLPSIEAISDRDKKFSVRFLDYPEGDKASPASRRVLVLIQYKDISICFFDEMKKVHFDPEFDWNKLKNCSVLVLSELGEVDQIIQVISAIQPQKIIFTRHYFRYERNKIPLLMQQSFSQIKYHRTAEGGALILKTFGEKLEVQPAVR